MWLDWVSSFHMFIRVENVVALISLLVMVGKIMNTTFHNYSTFHCRINNVVTKQQRSILIIIITIIAFYKIILNTQGFGQDD